MQRTDYIRKVKLVAIASDLVLDLLTQDKKDLTCIRGIPDGAFLNYAYWDDSRRAVILVIEHESFDPVPLNQVPEFIKIIYQRDFPEEINGV